MRLPTLRGLAVWAGVLAGVIVVVVTEAEGLWWMALVCGLLIGLLVRGWRAAVGGLLIGGLGWGIPLLWQARTEPVGLVAGVLGGLLGVGPAAALAVTLLVGVLLALAGAWVGIAARRLVSPLPEPEETPPSSTSAGS